MKKMLLVSVPIIVVAILTLGFIPHQTTEDISYSAEDFLAIKVQKYCECVGNMQYLHAKLKDAQNSNKIANSQALKHELLANAQNMGNCRKSAKEETRAYRKFINNLSEEAYIAFDEEYSERIMQSCPATAMEMGFKF